MIALLKLYDKSLDGSESRFSQFGGRFAAAKGKSKVSILMV